MQRVLVKISINLDVFDLRLDPGVQYYVDYQPSEFNQNEIFKWQRYYD